MVTSRIWFTGSAESRAVGAREERREPGGFARAPYGPRDY